MTATPSAPPAIVATGDAWWTIFGRISTAAAANTTPAARCWTAAVSR